MVLLLLGIGVAVAACGTPPPLDQAIKCDQFKRAPDGSWTTTTDVSLDYAENGTHYQSNFGKNVTDKADHKAHWRTEFERDGELLVYDKFKRGVIYNEEGKRRAALRWLTDEAAARGWREYRVLSIAMRSLILAVAAAIVGGVGIVLALLYH